ncbi:MAG TPA: hypothetical protein VGT98_12345 [Candidatus Elarobacter sp.]|nr:hypothetical protein [Candidatus Elarobacter sp.]
MVSRSFLSAATLLLVAGISSTSVRTALARDGASAKPASLTKANSVTFHAKDFAFTGPSTIPAGWTRFNLVNDGQNLHHMVVAKIGGGKTFVDLMHALQQPGPPPRWMELVGGPNAADPGGHESNATVDLAPGTYALLCFVDVPGGVAHIAKGMARELTVTPATASGSAPVADEVVTLSDYAFAFSKPLTAGKHVFEVRNTGPQPHELELLRLAPGKTADDMLAWIGKPNGPPPGSSVGGLAPVNPGVNGYFDATLTPGNYLFICFLPDARDGKAHYAHGMSKTITVH